MHLARSPWSAASLLLTLTACGGSDPKGPPQWEACRASAAARARVDADILQGDAFGVPGTPTLAVNGTRYFGLPPTQQDPRDLATIVASAIQAAQSDATARNIAPADYYQQAVVGSSTVDMPVPVDAAPVRGPADAWVTIVEFSDFECPFCRDAEPTLEAVVAAHPADVRLVYKEYPLPFHDRAMPAALAADCAGQQDKFWDMHDLLMSGPLDDAALVGYANRLGLQ
jgi:protein-disulfide isomerase